MLFVSPEFAAYFLVVYILYWRIPVKFRADLLLTASLIFFATWSQLFVLHFILIIFLNYLLLEKYQASEAKAYFYSAQILNVLNLCFFKYFYFAANAIGQILSVQYLLEENLRAAHRLAGYEIILPIAISFYTFEIMAYNFDVVRGVYTRRHGFRDVLLFVSFFPHLIAGPIMRARDLLPRIQALRSGIAGRPTRGRVMRGLWLIWLGIFKKTFLADQFITAFAPYTNLHPDRLQPAAIWLSAFTFMLMLYSDFSAYSDLCRGMGDLLGFRIPKNFRAPLLMSSFTDLWRRWHLTFSAWIRDYIFKPMGGSKQGELRQYRNLVVTFVIAGIWHGASYSFVAWGLCMGVFLCVEGFLMHRGIPLLPQNIFRRIFRISIVWFFYLITGVLFLGKGLDWSVAAILRMLDFSHFFDAAAIPWKNVWLVLVGVCVVCLVQLYEEKPRLLRPLERYAHWILPALYVILLAAIPMFAGEAKEFYYFQF